ncbi:SDR family oxidoreductase [Paraclostridium ghonii]|uniref:UDP-N-acetylglucosamine 4-epimerase n=1 Tax=Paraclostridium ghonii TaxID=29358 RepID=A0ABU0MW75_9FIRM|nr:SDR family oxidoreductase [Paeniclostridium ghonii]MDQ0555163.1 UDP-N-acetylglucosamine 4-epimerase [Paeniclostridium ghonii]
MGYQDIKFPKGTKFLVTGGAGFIGSNLTEALLNKGYFVRVLDNFSIGKRENIEEFMNDKNFELIKGDIRDIQICQQVCKGIDYVLHQAAWGSVPRSIEMPLLYEEINIKGTLNVMTAARDNNVKRFVYASSSSVYGDEPNLPKVEGKEGNLLSPYAITKKVNELYAKNYFYLYGLETVGLRYFNVFGRKQDPHSYYSAVIPKFVSLLLNNESPTINGDGEHSRDFTYIDNVIEANLRACLAPKEACGKAYNIAYGGRVSLNELYEVLKNLLNKDINPIYGPNRKGDIKHSNADISNARELLSYNPSYSFEDGIKLTIDWYKENL